MTTSFLRVLKAGYVSYHNPHGHAVRWSLSGRTHTMHTSDKGLSERGRPSQLRTKWLYANLERGQPLYKGLLKVGVPKHVRFQPLASSQASKGGGVPWYLSVITVTYIMMPYFLTLYSYMISYNHQSGRFSFLISGKTQTTPTDVSMTKTYSREQWVEPPSSRHLERTKCSGVLYTVSFIRGSIATVQSDPSII